MKTLFKDPVGWAEDAVGNVITYYVAIGFHILLSFWFLKVYFQSNNPFLFLAAIFGIYTLMYLYSMRHMWLELKKQRGDGNSGE